MNWIKTFFEELRQATDIFNLGRLVFYTSAGFLAFFPLLMIFQLIATEPTANEQACSTFFCLLRNNATRAYSDGFLLFFGSLVVGFVIATFGYIVVVQPISIEENAKLDEFRQARKSYSYSYRYKQLHPRTKEQGEEDYGSWLFREFYRYVEIATYIPLGLLAGLLLLVVYTAIFLVRFGATQPVAFAEASSFLLLITLFFGAFLFFGWREYWRPHIIANVVHVYIKAKISLINGMEDFKS